MLVFLSSCQAERSIPPEDLHISSCPRSDPGSSILSSFQYYNRVKDTIAVSSSSSIVSNFNSLKMTFLVHAGLFGCFRNQLNSDMDYTILNVCVCVCV